MNKRRRFKAKGRRKTRVRLKRVYHRRLQKALKFAEIYGMGSRKLAQLVESWHPTDFWS